MFRLQSLMILHIQGSPGKEMSPPEEYNGPGMIGIGNVELLKSKVNINEISWIPCRQLIDLMSFKHMRATW